jgi:hypothetical protein
MHDPHRHMDRQTDIYRGAFSLSLARTYTLPQSFKVGAPCIKAPQGLVHFHCHLGARHKAVPPTVSTVWIAPPLSLSHTHTHTQCLCACVYGIAVNANRPIQA